MANRKSTKAELEASLEISRHERDRNKRIAVHRGDTINRLIRERKDLIANLDKNTAAYVLAREQIDSLKRQITNQLTRESTHVAELVVARDTAWFDNAVYRRKLDSLAERDIDRSLELGEIIEAFAPRTASRDYMAWDYRPGDEGP